MDTEAGTQNPESPEAVEQQWFLDRFQEMHAQGDERLMLVNVYKELPITHPATICEIKGARVQLETSELQLAAISQCNEVYIQSPLLESAVLARLAGMDIRRKLVEVCDFSKADIKARLRSTVRVRLKKPMNVTIHAAGEKLNGVIHDVSVGGTCLKIMQRQRLEEADRLEIEIEIKPGLLVQMECALVHVEGDAPPYKCSFRFNHTPHTEELLSLFVHERQREILKQLRETL